jgi:[ribosomal protein S5]-alanine N-acetyltransferase
MQMKELFCCFPTMHTDRCELVEVDARFSKDIYELFSNDEVTRYLDGIDTFNNKSDANMFIELFKTCFYDYNSSILWGIKLAESQMFAGIICIYEISLTSRNAFIFFALNPLCSGYGFMAECLKQVLFYCFQELELNSIDTTIQSNNIRSKKVLQKAGFLNSLITPEIYTVTKPTF